jgi:UDP:flavonoid glycosyltransferase YjiC (YdhE family)
MSSPPCPPAGQPATRLPATPASSGSSRTARCSTAACAITHGGMGATQKALACGVPVCAVPFGRDQFEVARRVQVARAGSRLPAARLDPARLRAKVREAITCGDGARRVAAGYAAAGGPAAAADAIEQRLLGQTRQHPASTQPTSQPTASDGAS